MKTSLIRYSTGKRRIERYHTSNSIAPACLAVESRPLLTTVKKFNALFFSRINFLFNYTRTIIYHFSELFAQLCECV